MTQDHEYAVLGGVNRARVGRYLSLLAATASGIIVFVLLAAVDVAKRLGVTQTLPPVVLSLASAGAIYTALYWLFDRYAWRLPQIANLIRVPNLAGRWRCDGQTLNADGSRGNEWSAEMTIIQSWDKIRVRLKTPQSGSNSIVAALMWDDADGYRLLYQYQNEPRIEEPDLRGHRGFAELIFAKDRRTASGEYFNGHGRFTFGTMKLTRETA